MVWKPGHLPTAFLYDRKDGNLVHEVQLGDWDKETFIAELANYDFDPILDPYTLYNTAVHEITFQNTVYQLYSPIPHEQIAALADANTADIVEIYSDEVNDMLLDLVGPGVSVWLSGQRRNVLEGEHGANYAFRWAKQKSGRHEYGTWKEGEPDNAGSPLPGEQFAEACVVVRDKLFEDVACNTVHAGRNNPKNFPCTSTPSTNTHTSTVPPSLTLFLSVWRHIEHEL